MGGFVAGMAFCLFFLVPYAAYSETIEVITQRGNAFVLAEVTPVAPNETEGGSTSMLDGLGINSRLIHQEYGGSIVYGRALTGTEESIRPYHTVSADTRFMVAMLERDHTRLISIPEFYREYSYDGALLTGQDRPQNILGYSKVRLFDDGDMSVSNSPEGIIISGEGQAIVRLNQYSGQTIILSGELKEGTTIRLVQSPYDLTNIPYDPDRGFLINYCMCDPGTDTLQVLAGSTDDSVKSATLRYDQSISLTVYHGKCCTGRYTVSDRDTQTTVAHLIIRPHESGYLAVTGDATDPSLIDIRDVMRPGAKLFRTNHNTIDNIEHWIYDTLPVRESGGMFSGVFEARHTFPYGDTYLVIDSTGGLSKIWGTAPDGLDFIDITGLPADTAYRISRDDHTVSLGLTSPSGQIRLPPFGDHIFSSRGGQLHLYGESLTYLNTGGSPGTVVFDHENESILELGTAQNRAYNAHAYVKIPVIGTVEIGQVSLDGTLELPYLEGQYSDGDDLLIPIIPEYQSIHLEINGIPAQLDISDVLGGTGLKIADPSSSVITVSRPDGFIDSVEATAGAVTYMVATTDGNAKAHIRATLYGESEITNTRRYIAPPPPPPPPIPRDPLTAWVQVYVNGELREINGHTATQIHFDDQPTEHHTSGSVGISAHHTSKFSYPQVTVFDTISIPVREADFVEFYFYNHIYAEGSAPPIPEGHVEYRRNSQASATATILYASINTSM